MKMQVKRSIQFAAIIAVIGLTSCAKDTLTPGGVLGNPGLPENGTVTGSPGHSADHQQRAGSLSDLSRLNFDHPLLDDTLNAHPLMNVK